MRPGIIIKVEFLSSLNSEKLQKKVNNWFQLMQGLYADFGLFDIKYAYEDQTWTVMIIYEIGENKN